MLLEGVEKGFVSCSRWPWVTRGLRSLELTQELLEFLHVSCHSLVIVWCHSNWGAGTRNPSCLSDSAKIAKTLQQLGAVWHSIYCLCLLGLVQIGPGVKKWGLAQLSEAQTEKCELTTSVITSPKIPWLQTLMSGHCSPMEMLEGKFCQPP